MNTKNTENRKIKGELPAKIIWISGAVILGILLLNRFLSMGDPDESAIDCLKDGIKYLFYFVAYLIGIIYLFNRESRKVVFFSACIYAAAFAFSFILDLTDGGSIAANDLVNLVLRLIGYMIFAIFMANLAKGQKSRHYSMCLKLWFLPSLFLLGIGLVANLWVELARPAGFLWDGFILDMSVNVVEVIPIFLMSRVVKERAVCQEDESC